MDRRFGGFGKRVSRNNEMGGEGGHGAHPSIQALLNDLTAANVPLVVGGIKFNNPLYGGGVDSLERDGSGNLTTRVFSSLSAYQNLTSFNAWLSNGYNPSGFDTPELQLDALHYAALDMNAYTATTRKFIMLVTDSNYHENDSASPFTQQQIANELIASDCPLYISLWDSSYSNYYAQLLVNGGVFDPVNLSGTDQNGNWKYPFALLREWILGE